MGRVKELTPKPRIHTRKRSLHAEKEGESLRDEIWREEGEDRRRKLESHGGGGFGDLGHEAGVGGFTGEERKTNRADRGLGVICARCGGTGRS